MGDLSEDQPAMYTSTLHRTSGDICLGFLRENWRKWENSLWDQAGRSRLRHCGRWICVGLGGDEFRRHKEGESYGPRKRSGVLGMGEFNRERFIHPPTQPSCPSTPVQLIPILRAHFKSHISFLQLLVLCLSNFSWASQNDRLLLSFGSHCTFCLS